MNLFISLVGAIINRPRAADRHPYIHPMAAAEFRHANIFVEIRGFPGLVGLFYHAVAAVSIGMWCCGGGGGVELVIVFKS